MHFALTSMSYSPRWTQRARSYSVVMASRTFLFSPFQSLCFFLLYICLHATGSLWSATAWTQCSAKLIMPLILHHVFPLTFPSFFFGSCFLLYIFPHEQRAFNFTAIPSASSCPLSLWDGSHHHEHLKKKKNPKMSVSFQIQDRNLLDYSLKMNKGIPLRVLSGPSPLNQWKYILSLEINLDFLVPIS